MTDNPIVLKSYVDDLSNEIWIIKLSYW
jgi:hypothetical protein